MRDDFLFDHLNVFFDSTSPPVDFPKEPDMSVSTIVNAQKILGRYGLSALVIFGNIGNLLNIAIFIRTLRKQVNSCKMYLLAASITNWILINTSLISSLYGVDHIDPQHRSIVVCKLRWYGGQILLMLSRSFSEFDRLIKCTCVNKSMFDGT